MVASAADQDTGMVESDDGNPRSSCGVVGESPRGVILAGG
jgi:hypothetical protein